MSAERYLRYHASIAQEASMSFIDHVSCSTCNHYFSPEQIVTKDQGPSCPKCGNELAMTDIFGVGDAFVGVGDEEGMGMTLEDALPSGEAPQDAGPAHSAQSSTGSVPAKQRSHGESTVSALDVLESLKRR